MPYLRRSLPLLAAAAAIAIFYLYHLGGVGVLGPDEPRYAAIGRAMAQTRDFVTPRLWGSPWFEKPPLLYWMTALGTLAGLSPDVAGRLPVALLSLLFLAGSYWLLRQQFGTETATIATALLATSAGWVTYSGLCLTDLPMSVCFATAVFLVLPLLAPEPKLQSIELRFAVIGGLLGLGALAKGLVPLALALPLLWFLRGFWRLWWITIVSCVAVAAPWYVAVSVRNGEQFFQEFFWKHHFERLYSASLQHVQPWYYYIPVLLAGLFPWTPLFGLIPTRQTFGDNRHRFLAAVVGFGFLFFSIPVNKLPGYLLPLVPALSVLIAAQFAARASATVVKIWLFPCALLTSLIPMLGHALPGWLSVGRFSSKGIGSVNLPQVVYLAIPLVVIFAARRSWAMLLLVVWIAGQGIYVKQTAYPVLETDVSPRGLWHVIQGLPGPVCDAGLSREWRYGLAFYRGSPIPSCGSGAFDFALQPTSHGPPRLETVKTKRPADPSVDLLHTLGLGN